MSNTSTFSPSLVLSPRSTRQGEDEIEIDVVKVEADPESDIDIDGEDGSDKSKLGESLSVGSNAKEEPVSSPKNVTEMSQAAKMSKREMEKKTKAWRSPNKMTEETNIQGNIKIAEYERGEEEKSRRQENVRVEPPDTIMEELPEKDGKKSQGSETSREVPAGPADVRTEMRRDADMAREADTSTSRDKIRKSDTIWSPWK
ncbi:hypothetical protein PoB_001870400 [Plakobranchus ocellatus]|uniref:Uncharacterized protein n=1 Tax=Plakobranchus ocellatus TaxID=259542 RepID=A0AAV3ZEA1_9GAST|nr:hypothetical protein PoB_001870400 [Plakobranchus ocellatus]